MTARGNFFAVARAPFHRAIATNMNAACALLVLARYSGRDNVLTKASVSAIERHAGISRGHARAALDALVGANIIAHAPEHSRPSHPAYRIATDDDGDVIVPNSIVTGIAAKEPPLQRVRETQDPLTLRLLIDLYDWTHLAEDNGLSSALATREYTRTRLGEVSEMVAWGFDREGGILYDPGHPLVSPHGGDDFAARLRGLTRLHLADWVPTAYESADDGAQVILSLGSTEPEEDLSAAVDDALRDLLPEGLAQRATEDHYVRLLIPAHMERVVVRDVLRLRHRAHTSRTAAWYAALARQGVAYRARLADVVDRRSGSSGSRRIA